MFIYENTKTHTVKITRPDFRYYLLLDRELKGCETGCIQAGTYVRQAFMIHNQKFHDIYMHLAARLLSDMEVLATLLHQMHGEDDRYYDESNDDTPVFEFIRPCGDDKQHPNEEQHHVNNDLTAYVMRDMQYEQERSELYEWLIHTIEDDGADQTFLYLKEQAQESFGILENLLTILTTHTEVKDFGLGDSHNAFDLDTGNYFDKPNPLFLNPNEVEDIHK